MNLYHYTCGHGFRKIGKVGLLMPANDLMNPTLAKDFNSPVARYVWLTDLSVPIKDALGLTAEHIGCDRTVHRYRVTENAIAIRWFDLRKSFDASWRDLLESAPGARPAHWWVAQEPVPVEYDPLMAHAP